MFVLLMLMTAAVLLVLSLWYRTRHREFYNLLNKIPGPTPLPLLGNAPLLLGNPNKLLSKLEQLLDQHEGVVTLYWGWKAWVVLSDPADLEVFFNHPHAVDKGALHRLAGRGAGRTSLFTANGETWQESRAHLTPCFHGPKLQSFQAVFQRNSQALLELLRPQAGRGAFDVTPHWRRLTFVCLLESTLDASFTTMLSGSPQQELALKTLDIARQRACSPLLHPEGVFRRTRGGWQHDQTLQYMRVEMESHVNKHVARMSQVLGNQDPALYTAMLYELLRKAVSIEDVIDHMLTIIATGFDSTASSLSWMTAMLGIHQDVQEGVYQEVLTSKGSMDLPYLERVMKETLRLFPVLQLVTRHLSDHVQFNQYLLPKDTEVCCLVWKVHRDARYYADPLRFNPDRFLPDCEAQRPKHSYLPFGAGARGCIGEQYAMTLMKTVLSHLVLKYKLQCSHSMEELLRRSESLTRDLGSLEVSLEERKTTGEPSG